MADLNIKKWNGSAWEDAYPETTVGQIVATGTPSSSTYLRGDGTWATVSGGYTHPTHPGDDIDIDTGPLTGATVISDLDFNITSDTLGHITDANATVSTRNLTAADVGAAASSHTHTDDEISFSGSPLTSYTSSVYLAVRDANNELNFSGLNFGGSTSNYLSEAGTWEAVPSGGGASYIVDTLASPISRTLTTLTSSGVAVTLTSGKTYSVKCRGLYSTDTSGTGFRMGVISSTTSGTLYGGDMFVGDTTIVTGTTSYDHAPINRLQTFASAGNYLYATSGSSTTAGSYQAFGFDMLLTTSTTTTITLYYAAENSGGVTMQEAIITAIEVA